MRHILVPTNLLDYAENASLYAARLALHYNAKITLFHTYHIPVVDPLVPSEYLTELADSAEKTANNNMREQVANLQARFPDEELNIDFHTTMGFAADEIIIMAEKLGADFIVVGTRHRDTLQRILVGSVLGSVLENAKVPVIVIPSEVPFKPINNILFASEYNDSEDIKSIQQALEFGSKLDARLYSVHVNDDEPNENDINRLDGIRELFANEIAAGKLRFENIVSDNVIKALTDYSDANQVDMIMMVTHKRSFFERLFDRSISKQMAFRTDKPLVVFHK